jgi:hypothetical protein
VIVLVVVIVVLDVIFPLFARGTTERPRTRDEDDRIITRTRTIVS